MPMLGFCWFCHILIHCGTEIFLQLIAFASHPARIWGIYCYCWSREQRIERGLMTQGHMAICMQAFSLARLRGYHNASMQVWCSPLMKACICQKRKQIVRRWGHCGSKSRWEFKENGMEALLAAGSSDRRKNKSLQHLVFPGGHPSKY